MGQIKRRNPGTGLPNKRQHARSKAAASESTSIWQSLTRPRSIGSELKRRDLVFILKNLATLTENGVSLPRALGTLAEEKAMGKHRALLQKIRRSLENGESFSRALTQHSAAFDSIMINQVKVGERSGTIPETLRNIAEHREKAGNLRAQILRKLSYPILLVTVGSGVIIFLLMYVVPVFEDTYAEAGVPLPAVTQILIGVGDIARRYGWLLMVAPFLLMLGVRQLRRNQRMAFRMDCAVLRLPLLGHWLRDIAVLQLMEVLGVLMEAGFTLSDALGECSQSISNRAVIRSVASLQSAVNRGERFSREIERMGDTFPPIVSQLVIVGEQTGNLVRATGHIRKHLEQEIDRKTNLLVGTLEPILTISLATAIGIIMLAIYLPMFDMINTVGG